MTTEVSFAQYRATVARLDAAVAPGWDDLRVSVAMAKTGSSAPSLNTFRGGLQAYTFSASAVNEVFFDVQLPHAWVEGSEIRPHVHWSPGSSTDTGLVRWQLEYSWANPVNPIDNLFPDSTVATAVDAAAAGVAWFHHITSLGAIDGTNKRASSVLMCRLARVGNATEDTFTGAAFGLSVDFHIQVTGNGSLAEYPTWSGVSASSAATSTATAAFVINATAAAQSTATGRVVIGAGATSSGVSAT